MVRCMQTLTSNTARTVNGRPDIEVVTVLKRQAVRSSNRNLTEARRLKIEGFREVNEVNPSNYGVPGSPKWMKALLDHFNEPNVISIDNLNCWLEKNAHIRRSFTPFIPLGTFGAGVFAGDRGTVLECRRRGKRPVDTSSGTSDFQAGWAKESQPETNIYKRIKQETTPACSDSYLDDSSGPGNFHYTDQDCEPSSSSSSSSDSDSDPDITEESPIDVIDLETDAGGSVSESPDINVDSISSSFITDQRDEEDSYSNVETELEDVIPIIPIPKTLLKPKTNGKIIPAMEKPNRCNSILKANGREVVGVHKDTQSKAGTVRKSENEVKENGHSTASDMMAHRRILPTPAPILPEKDANTIDTGEDVNIESDESGEISDNLPNHMSSDANDEAQFGQPQPESDTVYQRILIIPETVNSSSVYKLQNLPWEDKIPLVIEIPTMNCLIVEIRQRCENNQEYRHCLPLVDLLQFVFNSEEYRKFLVE